jgi:ribosomal-protein-alanine N-acetyltransferase
MLEFSSRLAAMIKITYNKTYKTPRLVIRPYKLSDYKVWSEGLRLRNPAQNEFDLGPEVEGKLTKAYFKVLVTRSQNAAKSDQFYIYGMFDRKTGESVGSIDLYVIQRLPMLWGNLGYQVHNHKAGQGYAQEAAKMALKIGFKDLKFHRIEASIQPAHKASVKIAKAIGMTKEGLRKKFLPKGKKWEDAAVFIANK